jgi:hypothetical protein
VRAAGVALRTAVLVLAVLAVAAVGSPSMPNPAAGGAPLDDASCIQRSECCKVCDKGKACGNSCISRKYTCHKGRGCACDADEICE